MGFLRAFFLLFAAAWRPAASLSRVSEVVGGALSRGLRAEATALRFFREADVEGGFAAMGPELLAALGSFDADLGALPEYAGFERRWNATLQALPASFAGNIASFAATGDPDTAISVLTGSLDDLSAVAIGALPEAKGLRIANYLAAITDALEGVGESVDLVEEGHQVEGAQAFYAGMQASANWLVPQALQSESTYQSIVQDTQREAADIVGSLVNVVQQVMDSDVCWKRSVKRERSRPANCKPKFRWFGPLICKPLSNTDLLERPSCGEGTEARGGWCYSSCQPGHEPAHGHCKQTCTGAFPVNSPIMCGTSQTALNVVLMEIAARTAFAATSGSGLAEILKDAGVAAAGSMTAVLDAYVELAKPFGHPVCQF